MNFTMSTERRHTTIIGHLEVMLWTATARCPSGSIDPILARIIKQSEFAMIASVSDPLDEADLNLLAQALLSVLTSVGHYDTLGIRGVIPGIAGDSSRFEFSKAYAESFVYGAKVPGSDQHSAVNPDVLLNSIEEFLISVTLLARVEFECGQFLSLVRIVEKLDVYLKTSCTQLTRGSVYESLVKAMSAVEEIASLLG